MGREHGDPKRIHRRSLRRHPPSLDILHHDQMGSQVEGCQRSEVCQVCCSHDRGWYGSLNCTYTNGWDNWGIGYLCIDWLNFQTVSYKIYIASIFSDFCTLSLIL
jgi:hypothetical protein